MVRLLDSGVDGIITDRPDLLREVLIARGQWTPMELLSDAGQAVRSSDVDPIRT